MSVRPKSERHKKTFEWGRPTSCKEARTLARFEHPSIVRVTRVFEANSTAYMVMRFEQGQSFEAWLRGLGRPPTQDELDRIVAPLLDALQMMHAADFLHRDIAPDNIIVRADGTPVLLDFGAARRAVAEMSRALTGIVKAGYSPHEQYSTDGRLQGPWSDLYALGGTLYRAVTGCSPEEATLRVDEDRMAPAARAAKGSYRPSFLAAIDACLKVRHADRPRSVAQLRPMLFEDGITQSARTDQGVVPTKVQGTISARRRASAAPAVTGRRWAIVAAAVLVVAGGAFGGYGFTRWQEHQRDGAQQAGVAAEKQRRNEADAQRQGELDAEKQRKDEAAKADADRKRGDELRAAEAADRQRREAQRAAEEAEEKRKEEERKRIASRDDPAAKPRATRPDQDSLCSLQVALHGWPSNLAACRMTGKKDGWGSAWSRSICPSRRLSACAMRRACSCWTPWQAALGHRAGCTWVT